MVDHKKRTTLKTITAGAAIVATPMAVQAATSVRASTSTNATSSPLHGYVTRTVDAAQLKNTGQPLEINIESNNGVDWLHFSNVSDKPISVKHVSPGVARAGGRSFDVNAPLGEDALHIMPGQTYAYIVEPMSASASVVPMPDARIAPFTVAVAGQDAPLLGDVLTPRMVLS